MSAVKFTFNNDFKNTEPDVPVIDETVLNQAREEAYAQGVAAGKQQVLNSIEKQQEILSAQLIECLQQLARQHEEYLAIMQRDAARLAHAITSSLAPALVKSTPLPEIEMLVTQCLKNNPHEARLVVRVADHLLSPLQTQIDSLKDAAGFTGQIVLLGDAALQDSNCRVEWADGGAERDFEQLKATADKTIQLFLGAVGNPDDTPLSDNQFTESRG
tara:strand:- start:526 stop:1173 length:648 start_codon:yes stop_codon:yes gene_type:complete